MNVQITMMTLPRNISESQLWDEDASLSSLESFSEEEESSDESSSDEEEEEVEVACGLRRSYASNNKLIPTHLRHKKRQLSPPVIPRRATFQDALRAEQQQEEPTTPLCRWGVSRSYERVPSSIRIAQRPRRGPSRPTTLDSPMAKFRSDTSDSALSASKSFKSQQLRVSQANAKWNIHRKTKPDLNVFANTVNDSLFNDSSLLGMTDESSRRLECHHQRLSQQHETNNNDLDSAVGSRETRWSTSTHTKDTSLAMTRPRRRESGTSLHDSGKSLLSFGDIGSLGALSTDEEEEAAQDLKIQPSEPIIVVKKQPIRMDKFSSSANGSIMDAFMATTTSAAAAKNDINKHSSCPCLAFSMEDALQQVLALEAEDNNGGHTGFGLGDVDLDFPQVSVPRSDRTACSADSLVSLMSPFKNGSSSRRHQPLHKEEYVK